MAIPRTKMGAGPPGSSLSTKCPQRLFCVIPPSKVTDPEGQVPLRSWRLEYGRRNGHPEGNLILMSFSPKRRKSLRGHTPQELPFPFCSCSFPTFRGGALQSRTRALKMEAPESFLALLPCEDIARRHRHQKQALTRH